MKTPLPAFALVVALLAPACAHAQAGPADFRAELFNAAKDAETDLLDTDLVVFASSSSAKRVTTFEVSIALVTTGSIVNLITTQGETSITNALNDGASVDPGVEKILTFRGSSSCTYNLQLATATTVGRLIVTEVKTSIAMAGGKSSGAADGDSLGDLTPTDGNFAVGDGSAWVAESGATARTSLGLGTGDSPTFAALTVPGGLYVAASSAAYAYRTNKVAVGGYDESVIDMINAGVIRWAPSGSLTAPFDLTLARLGNGQLTVKGSNAQATNVRSVTTASSALSGATVTLTGARPAGSIIVGITLRVTTLVTSGDGGTTFLIGDGTDPNRYGDGIAFALGTTTTLASHTASPLEWLGAAGNVVLTCTGGTFSGGVVRLSVHYLDLTAPGS